MDKEFIDQMTTIPLTQRQYLEMELHREYIQYRIASYYVRRKPPSNRTHTNDPLLSIVLNYYLFYVEFGMLSLDGRLTATDDYYQVGALDHAGILCLSRRDGTVQVRRDIYLPEDEYNRNYFCAQNSTAFLQALLPAAVYCERCWADDALARNRKIAEGMLEHCCTIAGEKSEAFFRLLLHVPDEEVGV